MTRLSSKHPRYVSLVTRARLAKAFRQGLVVPEGLIAHGRAEAFDYLLGERTPASARRAERLAVQWIRASRLPVISVNGNVAALAAEQIASMVRLEPRIAVEVNLYHRTPQRVAKILATLRRAGIPAPLGLRPTERIPRLPSDRARVDARGIGRADVVIVPLEDGDRTEALRAIGKRVISIDLNPLSRTSQKADLPIVDELTRALGHMAEDLRHPGRRTTPGDFQRADAPRLLRDAIRNINLRLTKAASARSPRP
jgi:4-phosphopantoate---beta-alanine ligase